MFTSLVGKALVPVGVAVTGFVVVCCLLLYSVIKEDVNRDSVLHATNLADIILKSTRHAMLKSDRETLNNIIRNIGEQNGVEHVRIFNKKGVVNISAKPGEINHQVDKKAEGCISCHSGDVPVTSLGRMEQARTFKNGNGNKVLAITAPIYNEPECSNAACHVHPPAQKILGTLDIGLSREALDKSLAALRTQMILFTLMTLMLTVGGVTALLRRNVFLPIQAVRDYICRISDKDNQAAPPPTHLPQDLDRITKCFYNLMQKHNKTERELDEARKGVVRQE
ncbi:MAG TPA: hypothetical protein VGJ93_14185 [Desulfuromonadaceae bacterium]|jgi:sensor histidine kinase regulating citrate/malate metabolism